MSFSKLAGALMVTSTAVLTAQEARVPATAELQRMAARFVPTEITADVSRLSPNDRRVLAKLVEASKIIDALFLRQVWAGNEAMLLDLVADQTADGRARLHYFLINKGPWDRLDHYRVFVPGAPKKPEGANFYPEGASKAELERWMQGLSEADRSQANGFFTAIRRARNGSFSIVPYSIEYQNDLPRIGALLGEGGG